MLGFRMTGIENNVPLSSSSSSLLSSSSSLLLCGGSGPPGESGGTMFFVAVPLLSANLPPLLDCGDGDCPYPPTVGLCGSPASNLALLLLCPLLVPDDASEDVMLCLRALDLGGPAACLSSTRLSCGVAVLLGGPLPPNSAGAPLRLCCSSLGSGPLGGGDVGAPYDA